MADASIKVEEEELVENNKDDVKNEEHDCDEHIKNKKRKKVEEEEEEELEMLAREMLLRDVKRNKLRAERIGATGWYDFPRPKTNKRFAKAIVKSAVLGNTTKGTRGSKK